MDRRDEKIGSVRWCRVLSVLLWGLSAVQIGHGVLGQRVSQLIFCDDVRRSFAEISQLAHGAPAAMVGLLPHAGKMQILAHAPAELGRSAGSR